jgi:hypothetical protein
MTKYTPMRDESGTEARGVAGPIQHGEAMTTNSISVAELCQKLSAIGPCRAELEWLAVDKPDRGSHIVDMKIVYLNSGSPALTVQSKNEVDGTLTVVWFAGGHLWRKTLPRSCFSYEPTTPRPVGV